METKTLTIMFVDLVGYTKKTSETTRESFIELLETYKSLVEPIFLSNNGYIVKELGDGYMVAFESPTNAVLCGIDIQNSIISRNKEVSLSKRFSVKVAINTGEVQLKDNDAYGEAVNIASRLEGITKPNKIYFTETVFLSMNKNEVIVGFIGSKKLRGIPHPIKVYTVLGKYEKVLRKIKRKKKKFAKKVKRFFVIFLIFFFLLLLIGFAVFVSLDLF